MKIIGSLTSPFVRKVRIVMAEKKIDAELVLENVWDSDTSIAEFNPLSKVPCLLMDDGGAMFDSRVIAEYIDTLSPVGRLIPATGRERAAVKTWEALADGVIDAGILARLEKTFRNDGEQSEKWLERQMHKVHQGMETMSKSLGHSKWCHGNQFSLADIALGCALGWFELRFPELNWKTQYPNLAAHFAQLSNRTSFKKTAPPAQ
ncbi:glutathione S-transferase C-terminal domain-containing protein [Polynucleobacter sp. HIN5]|uniref:glutathione S-transferase C-terminal domain-containing protein n=1 Tax=Polynucleobacter sp. HIN5 TaxID=3047864 RepID=UPI00257371A9|nr:glutathione S-transferase C-terminal domain-containing protein [Polynucleobacter sp. HIN5]BEI34185.1 glutathione S-transferase N-terminal domain-containing protein [Polynucleobacter sp. HIN5]